MRIVVQRVKKAEVKVDDKIVGSIGEGALVFLGMHKDDDEKDVDYLVDRLVHLRFFKDENDKTNLSLLDINGEALIVSQFTLYADTKTGRRPSFTEALEPKKAENLYHLFVKKLRMQIRKVETGVFAARMEVSLINDGPFTLIVER